MTTRSVEDRLREEYFTLLPEIRSVMEEVEAEVRHCLLPVSRRLQRHERLIVKSRVKECESAVDALRRRVQEGRTFDQDRFELYSLTQLNDLAGVRVLVFPRSLLSLASSELRKRFPLWTSDPPKGYEGRAEKYFGRCSASEVVHGEVQIIPMLTALFWEVEHDTFYKPQPRLIDLVGTPIMQQHVDEVLIALEGFEQEFERLIRISDPGPK
jgi:ppGpp synthetase/RelA/SpoT-type nucleotidyltranferase